jgi:hypothetical protein
MPLIINDHLAPMMSTILSFNLHTDAWITSQQILDIIFRYKCPLPKDTVDRSDEGAMKSLAILYRAVKGKQPVRMVLPAFPFKSPNTKSKVLGTLPDKAEDVALAHLNGMCAAIQAVYPFGVKLVIVSDGIVYNGNFENSKSDTRDHTYSTRPARSTRSCGMELREETPRPSEGTEVPQRGVCAPH